MQIRAKKKNWNGRGNTFCRRYIISKITWKHNVTSLHVLHGNKYEHVPFHSILLTYFRSQWRNKQHIVKTFSILSVLLYWMNEKKNNKFWQIGNYYMIHSSWQYADDRTDFAIRKGQKCKTAQSSYIYHVNVLHSICVKNIYLSNTVHRNWDGVKRRPLHDSQHMAAAALWGPWHLKTTLRPLKYSSHFTCKHDIHSYLKMRDKNKIRNSRLQLSPWLSANFSCRFCLLSFTCYNILLKQHTSS